MEQCTPRNQPESNPSAPAGQVASGVDELVGHGGDERTGAEAGKQAETPRRDRDACGENASDDEGASGEDSPEQRLTHCCCPL